MNKTCITQINEPELLLQRADDSALDLVEVLQLTEGDEDDDSLAATVQVKLLSSGDEGAVKVSLQLGGRGLFQI